MKRILLSIIIIIFSITFLKPLSSISTSGDVELMHEVQNETEAILLAEKHQITLIDYSKYGFALFNASSTQSASLIKEGFEVNQTASISRPWQPPTTTEDPYMDEQYALDHIYVTEAWTKTTGDPDLLIAIIDTGIDTDHEEFTGRISPLSYNARTKEVGLSHVEDDEGHGTFVAGIIAANKDNSKGIAGIVQQGSLLIIKANNLDNLSTEENEAKSFSDSNIIEAIYYAVEQGADIINMSLGGSSPNTLVRNAVDYAFEQGVILVAASGNDGDDTPLYPASYENVISVGATDENKTIAPFSNYNEFLDVVAPGVNIVSTALNNTYAQGGGTSYAAPHVAAALALMKAYFPTYTNTQIIEQLESTAVDLGVLGVDPYYGHGLISLLYALQVSYVTVTFETFGGTLMDAIEVVKDIPFVVEEPIKEGHTFVGWYLDQALTIPFMMTEDVLSENQTLYAKYSINSYQISFVAEGLTLPNESVIFQTLYEPEDLEKEGYIFEGWYLDDAFEIPYEPSLITSNITLYAKFSIQTFRVTYYHQSEILESITYQYLETPTLFIPDSIYPFIGWYLDPSFQQPYINEPITKDMNLYAKFDDNLNAVTFYSYDLLTVLEVFYVSNGSSITPPDAPNKPDSSVFTFTFTNWSLDTTQVIDDMVVYPVYEVSFIEGSIKLGKGIDTLSDLELWVDGGLSISDQSVSYETYIIEITPLLYEIRYDVIYEQNIMTSIKRYVSIIEKPYIEMTLNPAITTLYEGEDFKDTGLNETYDELEVIYPDDLNQVGMHEVIYRVTLESNVFEKIRYIFVLEKDDMYQIDDAILSKESELINHAT